MCRTQTHIIDFDDMIWMPIVNGYPFPKYDVLFVDEAQDFNEAATRNDFFVRQWWSFLLLSVIKPSNLRLSVVLIQTQLPCSDNDFKGERKISEFLSITWRCPNSVVREANRYVREFNAPDFAEEGTVIVDAPFNPQRNDMVLCRYNAPLVSAFMI